MMKKSLFLKHNLIFGIENELKFTFSFITTLPADKIDPKVVGFLLTTKLVIINLALLTLAFPKSHKNLLKPTF